jgi:hypothetical protein
MRDREDDDRSQREPAIQRQQKQAGGPDRAIPDARRPGGGHGEPDHDRDERERKCE